LSTPSRPEFGPKLGFWAALALSLIAVTVIFSDLVRLRNPIGEKFIPPEPPGQIDFSYAYTGARALLAGENPYHNDKNEFTSPIFKTTLINGVVYKQIYPIGQILLDVPLALWKGADWQAAGRVWFGINLIALGLLGVLTWALTQRVMAAPFPPIWIFVFSICLALSTGVELCLERGQSEIFTAALCWGAIACTLREKRATAAVLAVWAASIKGYPVLFTAGLLLLGLRGAAWKRTVAGAALAVVLFVIPGLPFMADGLRGTRFRSAMFMPHWYNHGFKNTVYTLAPALADSGRLVLTGFALIVTVAAWVQARRAAARGPAANRALWLAVFAVSSLGTIIGYSALSVSYNLVLILPGVLALVVCQDRLIEELAWSSRARHVLGAALLGTSFMLFVHRLGGKSPSASSTGFAATGVGLVALFVVLATTLGRALRRPALVAGPPDE
jgi:hypothetical protein